jgi:NADH-quinone oxidoreductase subunit H
VPLALLNLANAAFWALTTSWTGPLQLARWAISAAIVVLPFLVLSRRLNTGRGPRTYRYAQ